ncbi:MAG: EAL domain-containing protein [Candidatus Electrothrix aestuarii]|uniref:EAL domain-containing protein n=1 Tax=Candidatus Electrothrix aestuarii TaxID=3062594 RepID=A0AAU8LVG6_9BACT|nr:EAL domain-containing protein [Candidatus Electrothrix aestuarii]
MQQNDMLQQHYIFLKNKYKKVNLTGKLSLLVILGVLSAVGVLGCYFDSFLEETFLEDAKSRILYGFRRLSTDLETTTEELREGIFFVQTDENFLASVELINNYQDKKNYNAILLDEEKKAIARQLLNRVKLSLNHFITLYGKDEELIAFVEQQNDGYHLHFISYEDGHKILYSRHEDEPFFTKSPLPKRLPIDSRHQAYYSNDTARQGATTYHVHDGKVLATSHISIFDDELGSLLMHIEMSHLFNDEYFTKISEDLGLIIRYSTKENKASQSQLLTTIGDAKELHVEQGERAYFSTARINITSRERYEKTSFYYNIALNKEKLLTTLAKNRRQFLLLIIIVTFMVLLTLRLIFFKTLISPLDLLMEQIRKIEKQNYEQSSLIQTGDELEKISKNINQLAGTVQDRERALLASQKKLEYLSLHDTLTGLPNRRLFHQRLVRAIRRARHNRSQLAILFLDLDEFKQVNDTLGHDIGDQLLANISLRLTESWKGEPLTIARLGGDEFTILIEEINEKNEVAQKAEKLLKIFHSPFICSGYELSTTASVGIALFPGNGEDAVTLIKHADMAMYQAKELSRNNYSFFSAELAAKVKSRIDRVNALKKAVRDLDEFHLLYQPKICLQTGRVKSMEALVRWQSSSLGFVLPDQFIRLAEESKLIIPLGEWIIERAFRDFMLFRQSGSPTKKICVNVSGVQLINSDIVDTILQAMSRTGIHPEQIELEITEGSLATKEKKALKALDRLREMRIDLAIDDFGTGYSSMSYLQQLPVTRLKIDKSFIDHLPNSAESGAIVQAIIALARTFHLHITAEGVETAEQSQFLKQLGCDEVQGYFYASPLSSEEFLNFSTTFTAADLT